MNKVKITILKTTLDKDLVTEYGALGLCACPMLSKGQVFYADYEEPLAIVTSHNNKNPLISSDLLVFQGILLFFII